MRTILLLIIFNITLFSNAQSISIKVVELCDTSIREKFNINCASYQKMALSKSRIVFVDSNAQFIEYDLNNFAQTLNKGLKHRRFNYSGKLINYIEYIINSNDFLIIYKGGVIDQFIREANKSQFILGNSDNINKIQCNKESKYAYWCSGYELAFGGMFSKTPLMITDKKTKNWRWAVNDYHPDSIKQITKLERYIISDFSVNKNENGFLYLATNNELTYFRTDTNFTQIFQPEQKIKNFQLIGNDIIMWLLNNGVLQMWDIANLQNPYFENKFENNIIDIIYSEVRNKYITIFDDKVQELKLDGDGFKVITEMRIKGKIIDFKIKDSLLSIAIAN